MDQGTRAGYREERQTTNGLRHLGGVDTNFSVSPVGPWKPKARVLGVKGRCLAKMKDGQPRS